MGAFLRGMAETRDLEVEEELSVADPQVDPAQRKRGAKFRAGRIIQEKRLLLYDACVRALFFTSLFTFLSTFSFYLSFVLLHPVRACTHILSRILFLCFLCYSFVCSLWSEWLAWEGR